MMAKGLLVIGSLNIDLVARLPSFPRKGETITGIDFNSFLGGKGNNQAIAAARAGGRVTLIGKTGADRWGDELTRALAQESINTKAVLRDPQSATGIANIWIGPDGDNSIVIVPNANENLSPQDLEAQHQLFQEAQIVLLQLESQLKTVIKAAQMAKEHGAHVILNTAPAPVSGELPPELVNCVDTMVLNETECQTLTGILPQTEEQARQALAKLHSLGVKTVIITLGSNGVYWSQRTPGENLEALNELHLNHMSAYSITVCDTTAAGDAFCGALACALSQGKPLNETVNFASAAGALACTKLGAVPSLPQVGEIMKLMAQGQRPWQ
jgi:ribokinase